MTDEDLELLVRDAFAEHERLTPDPDAVLAATRQQLDHQPHRGRVLAVAATVVAVAGGATAIALHGTGTPATRADGPRSAHRSVVPSLSSAASDASTRPVGPAPGTVPPLTMPYDLGWLPSGTVHYHARRINVGQAAGSSTPSFDGEYLMTVTTGARKLDVDVQQMPGTLRGVGFKCGPAHSVRIDGRRGVESADASGPCGYELYFTDSDGGVMYVNVMHHAGRTGGGAVLRAIGRHIAREVRFPGTVDIHPTFGIGRTPAGTSVVTFDVSSVDGIATPGSHGPKPFTEYGIGTTHDQIPPYAAATSANAPRLGTAGRRVQGHATRRSTSGGERELEVLHAVHGGAVFVTGYGHGITWAQLYRIADGLRLP